MADEFEPAFELTAPPPTLPDRRGRRKLRFAVEVYERVEVLAGAGMLQDDIAAAVGVSAPSLRKYFRPELGNGSAILRARMLDNLVAQADKGSTSAAKAVLDVLDKHQAAANYRRPERPASAPRPAEAGKKAAQRADADAVVGAGAKFAPRGAVRLATANGETVATED